MVKYIWLIAGIGLSSASSSEDSHFDIRAASIGISEPCAEISKTIHNQTIPALVPAALGYACLTSVPIDKEHGKELIDEIKFYLQWQSTLEYLKNPPSGSRQRPIDLIGELDNIRDGIDGDRYANEYDLQNSITLLLESAHDGHLYWLADIFSVISFTRHPEAQLISISEDGQSLPKIFSYSDIIHNAGDSSFQASPIVAINNVDAVQYLAEISVNYTFADDDARFSSQFVNPAGLAYGDASLGGFSTGLAYDGPETTFKFENGTTRTLDNFAAINQDFSDVKSGADFFEKFCTGKQNEEQPANATASQTSPLPTSTAPSSPTLTGYPFPVVKHAYDAVSGYFLNETGYEDVAILAIPTFLIKPLGTVEDSMVDASRLLAFQAVVRKFIEECRKSKKQKLIIDLRNNFGGDGFVPTDTFKQLFPEIEPTIALNILHNDAYKTMGEIVTKYVEGNDLNETEHARWYNARLNLYMADEKVFLKEDGTPWKDFAELYGSDSDMYTRTMIENYNEELTQGYGGGLSVSGHLNNTNVTKEQPFAQENVLVLVDSSCASACALFTEVLRTDAKLPILTMATYPHEDPITAPTGTKGALQLGLSQLELWTGLAERFIPAEDTDLQSRFNSSGLAELTHGMPNVRRRAMIDAGLANSMMISVNARNNVRKGEKTPLQFVWEDADCKMWYTADMYLDVTKVWMGAVDAWWGKKCVGKSGQYEKRWKALNDKKTGGEDWAGGPIH